MSNRSDTDEGRRDIPFTALFTLVIAAMGCAIVVLAVPRHVAYELPIFALPEALMREEIARDEQLAQSVRDDEVARALDAVLLTKGLTELGDVSAAKGKPLHDTKAIAALFAKLSSAQKQALCARATTRFMRGVRGELTDERLVRGLIGAQAEQLIEHGYIDESGALLAPELSVRATYKVRWNMLFDRPPTEGLRPLEQLAYEGFRALEARRLPRAVRTEALRSYLALRGPRAREAWLIWSAMNGQPAPLVKHLRQSPEARAQLRLRNMGVRARDAMYEEGQELESLVP